MPGNCRWKEKAQEPGIARQNRNKRTRVLKTHACVFVRFFFVFSRDIPDIICRQKASGTAERRLLGEHSTFCPFCPHRPANQNGTNKICTTLSKHGTWYPRAVYLPEKALAKASAFCFFIETCHYEQIKRPSFRCKMFAAKKCSCHSIQRRSSYLTQTPLLSKRG